MIVVNGIIVSSNNSYDVLRFNFEICLVCSQLKFNTLVKCDMAFMESMHSKKPTVTYLFVTPSTIMI